MVLSAGADAITMRSVVKTYGALVAVDNLSLSVAEGETMGLLGPNGAGKTTTIHMIAGVLTPDRGEISLLGQAVGAGRLRLGVATQAPAIYEDLTAEENCRFFGRLYGLSGPTLVERTDFVLAFVGLSDRAKDRVRTYSGGMKRRMNLAVALVHDPPVLLLDEPTVGVDPQSRNLIFEKIEELQRQGRTILYSTHYMEEAERLCDRVAILDRGRLLALGTVEELVERHAPGSTLEVDFEREPGNPEMYVGSRKEKGIRVETLDPVAELARVQALAAREGHLLRRIRIERKDLESVFLALTGKALRDEE